MRPGARLHGLAVSGMAVSAIVAILTTVLFVSVGWPGAIARVFRIALALSLVGLLACAAIAVLAAARESYAAELRERGSHED